MDRPLPIYSFSAVRFTTGLEFYRNFKHLFKYFFQ